MRNTLSVVAVPIRRSLELAFLAVVIAAPGFSTLKQAALNQFEEPLVRTAPTSRAEDAELEKTLQKYQARTQVDDLSALQKFLKEWPESGWRAALLTNLGLSYYHYGYFSKAIESWEQAWQCGRGATDVSAKALVDRALGELARMHARLGHGERLEALFKDIGNRAVTGPATEAIAGAQEGLWMMQHEPGVAYLCGPMALKSLLLAQGKPLSSVAFLDDVRSSPRGVSLTDVARLADRAKLPYDIVLRKPGEPVPVPSIIHWKVNHFAAIVGQAKGRFHIQDPTFGPELWVTAGAIDAEASGYFLVPREVHTASWRKMNPEELSEVRGMGFTSMSDPTATRPSDTKSKSNDGCSGCPKVCGRGMTCYNVNEMLVSLTLNDTPVGYAPPKGPDAYVTLTYNQREASQPANFNFFNVSPKWTFNWLTYIQDDPTMTGANVMRYVAGGGAVNYIYETSTQSFEVDPTDGSVLVMTSTNPVVYQRQLPNGGLEIYSQSDEATTYPRRVFLTQMIDPAGTAVALKYEEYDGPLVRLISLTDATGRATQFFYDLTGRPLLVTRISDPFGRTAKLQYDFWGRLSQITDVIGLTSTLNYDYSGLVTSMTTAYGTTSFASAQAGTQRVLEITDPLGNTERVEYRHHAPGLGESDPSNTVPPRIIRPLNLRLEYRNSFYWDKHAYALAVAGQPSPDYTQARIRHWAHLSTNTNATSSQLESYKMPLENRVWFNHPGQPSGNISGTLDSFSRIARVLDDGSQQLTVTSYNSLGNPTEMVDPIGREALFTYAANGVDVLTIYQKTSPSGFSAIASYTYNNQHLPLTYTDAAGQTTTYAYNAAGQLTQETDALGEVTQYQYDANGYLTTIINANGKTAATFTYDQFGRVATSTDSEGYTLSYAYDAFDRPTQVNFPDGTTRQYTYNNLDLVSEKDRQGRVTQYVYDAVRNLITVTDPLGRKTNLSYYENRALKSLTDPNDHTTNWAIDIESRVISKQYADGRTFSNTYELTTSRLKSITDPLAQVKQFTYAADDEVTALSYLNAVNPTPSVAFSYDPYFSRVVSMTDGTGTTKYSYVPPGSLGALDVSQETGPFANSTISYQYDALGRVVGRGVDSKTETFAYDKLGRSISHGSPLGAFNFTYLGQTGQVTSSIIGTGPVGTNWVYDSNTNDRRLKQILNSGTSRSYALTTTPEYLITQIAQTGSTPQTWNYSYDNSNRLLQAQSSTGGQYQYNYDPADNILTQSGPGGTENATYNDVNQLVTFNGSFPTYDANGNLTSDSLRTYAWDAENRLIGIGFNGQPGRSVAFRYDGLGDRIAIVAANGGGSVETHYLWCEDGLCQQRTATDAVSRRYYPEGEYLTLTGTGLYYAQDQLDSVRDVLSVQNGSAVGSFDYDPYGNVTQSSGTASTDFRYAGLFFEPNSGIYLADHRAYDPGTSRWLNRDPSGIHGGSTDLYAYAALNPIGSIDPSGLVDINLVDPTDTLYKGMQAYSASGYLTVGAHGSNGKLNYLSSGKGAKFSVEDVGRKILASGWKPATPVRLVACYAGQDKGFAAQLAQYLANITGASVTIEAAPRLVTITTGWWFPTQAKPAGILGWYEFTASPMSVDDLLPIYSTIDYLNGTAAPYRQR